MRFRHLASGQYLVGEQKVQESTPVEGESSTQYEHNFYANISIHLCKLSFHADHQSKHGLSSTADPLTHPVSLFQMLPLDLVCTTYELATMMLTV